MQNQIRQELDITGEVRQVLRTEVLVVGGGPAGAAAGFWLARLGHDVTVIERKKFPREKTCGDGLTPRAVKQLDDMGLSEQLSQFHRYEGLRATAHGKALELKWPTHPIYPQYGYVVRRRELDMMVARNAQTAGAKLLEEHEAVAPIISKDCVRGAMVTNKVDGSTIAIHAEYVIIADGANSRFGRAIGTAREKSWPYGTAIRTYWKSPRHQEPWIESALDVKDRNGKSMPGYGWIFPVGDGTINIGSVNPFNGEGIDYAYETAHLAADVLHDALITGDASVLKRYDQMIEDEYGQYFKVARLFARIIGRPVLMRELSRVGIQSRTLMEWVLRIMANLLRPDEIGPAEAAYKAAALIVRAMPDA